MNPANNLASSEDTKLRKECSLTDLLTVRPKRSIQLSWTQTLTHGNRELINVHCFQLLNLWYFVTQRLAQVGLRTTRLRENAGGRVMGYERTWRGRG